MILYISSIYNDLYNTGIMHNERNVCCAYFFGYLNFFLFYTIRYFFGEGGIFT